MKIRTFGLCYLFAVATVAQAATVGVTVSGGDVFNNGTWTLGYSFLVNTSINVTSLGVYDNGGDGLLVSHDVGLWDSSGNLLASTTVAAGTAAPLDSGFRFSSISSVALSAGSTYYVGAVIGFDDPWLQDPTVTSAPEITYVSRQYEASSGSLVFPDLAGSGTTGYFGGNFQFGAATSQVPEPSTWALAIGALAGLSTLKRRRRQA
jgi:hypothetical protein